MPTLITGRVGELGSDLVIAFKKEYESLVAPFKGKELLITIEVR